MTTKAEESPAVPVVAWLAPRTNAVTSEPSIGLSWCDGPGTDEVPIEPLIRYRDHLAAIAAVHTERNKLSEFWKSVASASAIQVYQQKQRIVVLQGQIAALFSLDAESQQRITALKAALAAKPASAMVPSGWQITRVDDKPFKLIRVVAHNGWGATVSSTDRNPEILLYMLADALLSADQQPVGA